MTTGRINQVTSLKDVMARAPRQGTKGNAAQDVPRASFVYDNGHTKGHRVDEHREPLTSTAPESTEAPDVPIPSRS